MTDTKMIRIGSQFIMLITALAWLVWIYHLLSFLIPVFTQENYWQNLGMVEDHIEIGWFPWLAYLGLWVGIFVIGSGAFFLGFRLLNLYRKGEYFTDRSVRTIQYVGMALVVAMIWDTLVDYLDHALLTWNNTGQGGVMPDGAVAAAKMYLPPVYRYDSGDISLLLCGLAFCLIGYVLRVAKRLEAENKEIV